jgi:hypothetical protein
MPVIEASQRTKDYRLGAIHGVKRTLLNAAARLRGKAVKERPLSEVLDDVSFDIKRAESHFADVT